ncbi:MULTISPECIES: stage II sporulation protein M [unclassified Sphingomonas]|uniref:stage II sporulation protein M n=1 Tax=unclassified Sphingomonas TaxID=196159 RepID=UPI002150A7ED|nr:MULTISPECIES: stage II sporulation protein M [unclassified Sphingomonas]MCR5872392.1 stage II sporulation protein M [Sphingomonas sp. J344]UUX99319.1 stage II sporulation protein M [Sphingomonas sp. J315]
MTSTVFGVSQFRAEREADWKRLEALLDLVEKKSPRRLTSDDLFELPRLYRSTLSALSIARETSLDGSMIAYLESLSNRAYFILYGCRDSLWRQLGGYFTHGWPAAVRGLVPEILIIAALFMGSGLAGYFLVMADPAWFGAIVPSEFAAGRNMQASVETLRESIYGVPKAGGLEVFATELFTHNSRVSIMAFALGFAFGIPTLLLIASNGVLLGAFYAVFVSKGLGVGFTGWLMIHGSTELSAIILAGAAGLHIGRAVAFPGVRSRLAAAGEAGRRGALVMIGVVIMLLAAGLLEGFARQLITVDAARFAIAAGMFALWVVYFALGGRRRHG